MNLQKFIDTIWRHYDAHGRGNLPWRHTRDPYRILVSEIMLQQTQVSRVMNKYAEFLKVFPTAQALARAPISRVLAVWKGLGYNRRALNLQRAAKAIVSGHGGTFPRSSAALEALPGIGQSTRGALMAFAFGVPTPFIETNIRAVFIHFFCVDKTNVHDKELLPLIEKTLPSADAAEGRGARDWYYALMDYGAHLKRSMPNPSRKSAHHVRQSPFKGSNRELRSDMLGLIMEKPISEKALIRYFLKAGKDAEIITKNLFDLEKEGFIGRKRNLLTIA